MSDFTPADARHPGTLGLLQFFDFQHLPPHLQAISAPCHDLAFEMASTLPDGPELTAGLRKLLEAKDAFVRQALIARTSAVGAEQAMAEIRRRVTAGD